MPRKTIPLSVLKEKVNHLLKHSADFKRETRQDIGLFLSDILLQQKVYNGFRYLTQDEMKTSLKGMSFGIDQSLPENEWFVNMDPTRVLYF
ncbi:MAG: hypothetical protein PF503_06355 [Desulfobacula sp.]|jgi:hypothetical protein|nr:hypothetical protein [Desulfobacula sp.]